VDETGQADSPDTAGAHQDTGGQTEAHTPAGGSWPGAGPTSDDSLAAIVSSWREPVVPSTAGRASVSGWDLNGNRSRTEANGVNGINGTHGPTNGVNGAHGLTGGVNGARGRAEVRSAHYPDPLAPVSPPVPTPPSLAPPAQPVLPAYPAQSPSSGVPIEAGVPTAADGPPLEPPPALHYGHYGPDGQGWPPSDLPPGYQPMPTYPAAGQPGYPAADPAEPAPPPATYPAQPTSPAQPTYPAQSGFSTQPSYPTQSGYPVQPSHSVQPSYRDDQGYSGQPPYAAGQAYGTEQDYAVQQNYAAQPVDSADPVSPAQPTYPGRSIYPAQPTYPEQPTYREQLDYPGDSALPVSPGYAASPSYDDLTPLFDQQRAPVEPDLDWTTSPYPIQRPPSDALASDTSGRGGAVHGTPLSTPPPCGSAGPGSAGPGSSGPGSSGPSSGGLGSAALGSSGSGSAGPGLSGSGSSDLDSTGAGSSIGPSSSTGPSPSIRPGSSGLSSSGAGPGGYGATGYGATGYGTAPPGLPQRVPAEPDVPPVPEIEPVPVIAPHAAAPDLARIATYLRHDEDDEVQPDGRPDGFDIPAVLEAVRGVAGVREARLRANPGGVHTLRLELADDADPGLVSRAVARLLNERMGLAAEPNLPESLAPPAPAPRSLSEGPGPTAPPPYSAMPTYGREARRRRPISDLRRPAEPQRGTGAEDRAAGKDLLGNELPGKQPSSEPSSQEPSSNEPSSQEPSSNDPSGNDPLSKDLLSKDLPSRALPRPGAIAAPRVVIDQVEVSTQGVDAIVEVRLTADGGPAIGVASGPSVDDYVLRLSAVAAAAAIDQLLVDCETGARGRCFIEHAALLPLGSCEVAVVVLLLTCDGWVEQLTGSAVVVGDPRQAVVRATLAAVNRRLEALLP
jgi:hypothetical protein